MTRFLCGLARPAALLAAGILGFALHTAWTSTATAESEPDAVDVLTRAFHNRYEISFTSEIELAIELRGNSVRRRVLNAATLYGDGDYRAIGQLEFPHYLRGMTVLSISEDEGGHQAFIYLPSQQRVKRISFTHRDDAFLGSDLTYEDFERRRITDYRVNQLSTATLQNEAVYVVDCEPATELSYDRAEFYIAKKDYAILEIRESKNGESEPVRRMTAPRDGMTDLDGHIIATVMRFENFKCRTATRVAIRDLAVEKVDKRIFTVNALERRVDISR